MSKPRTILITAIASGLLAGSTIGVAAHEGLAFIAQATWKGFSGMDVHGYIVDTTES